MKRQKTQIRVRQMLVIVLSTVVLCMQSNRVAAQEEFALTAPSVILMEASTGTVIYEKNAEERRSPASITKIMTAILIFEALEEGRIALQDEVVTSSYAKSMGGSQVFLEEGEIQTVDTLIKCILVASGNDASVAMAEYIYGSEEAFVQKMNQKATEIGMKNSHFTDCCGLTDSKEHYTSARDVAIMSSVLIRSYPQVKEYTTIWMDTILHETRNGSNEFGLANTNKLLKQYEWTTGLKTGSTAAAKYCLSATAAKNGVELIAVIMGCPNYKDRFTEAKTLLQYGYQVCHLYEDTAPPMLEPLAISGGTKEYLHLEYSSNFQYLDTKGISFDQIEKEQIFDEYVLPIQRGMRMGELRYKIGETMLGSIEIVASEDILRANYFDSIRKIWYYFIKLI